MDISSDDSDRYFNVSGFALNETVQPQLNESFSLGQNSKIKKKLLFPQKYAGVGRIVQYYYKKNKTRRYQANTSSCFVTEYCEQSKAFIGVTARHCFFPRLKSKTRYEAIVLFKAENGKKLKKIRFELENFQMNERQDMAIFSCTLISRQNITISQIQKQLIPTISETVNLPETSDVNVQWAVYHHPKNSIKQHKGCFGGAFQSKCFYEKRPLELKRLLSTYETKDPEYVKMDCDKNLRIAQDVINSDNPNIVDWVICCKNTSIAPGSSGGAMINTQGQAVGILSGLKINDYIDGVLISQTKIDNIKKTEKFSFNVDEE